MNPPKGCYIRLAPRSGLSLKHKIQVGAGVIDPDYTGEIGVVLFNHSNKPFSIGIGDKIAQAIMERAEVPRIRILKYLKPSRRGTKGFGSSNTVDTKQISIETNVCESNPKTSQYQRINHGKLLVLPKLMERPHGCCFIGSKPSTLQVSLGQKDGPKSEVIIDSGSDITLVSQKTLSSMKNPPKEHTGKKVTLSQVTAKTSIGT